MKSFVAPHSIESCKARLALIQSAGILGFVKIKVKLVPNGGGDYRYVVWKTMRGNFGADITLAEVSGEFVFRDHKMTDITGVSRMGRFYRIILTMNGLVILFSLVSYLSTQKLQYLFGVIVFMCLLGWGWLLTFYWRNQIEGMVEQALMK